MSFNCILDGTGTDMMSVQRGAAELSLSGSDLTVERDSGGGISNFQIHASTVLQTHAVDEVPS